MKKFAIAGLIVTLLADAALLRAQDAPKKEHEWLQQFAGEWESDAEVFLAPGQPPLKWKGPASARALGRFWIVAESTVTFMDQPLTGIRTLGYDTQKKKFVGTWVASFSSYLWKYEGTVDAAGKILTLEAEGPSPHAPGTLCKWKDVIEFKSKDHRLFTNSVQVEDGKWVTVVIVNSRRKQ